MVLVDFFPPGDSVNTQFGDDEIFTVLSDTVGTILFRIKIGDTWQTLGEFEDTDYQSINIDTKDVGEGTYWIYSSFQNGGAFKTKEWTWNVIAEAVPFEFDSIEPSGTSLNLSLNDTQKFRVSTTKTALITWYLDGESVGDQEGTLSDATFIGDETGTYQWKVEAVSGIETISHTWNITVSEDGANGNGEPTIDTNTALIAGAAAGALLLMSSKKK